MGDRTVHIGGTELQSAFAGEAGGVPGFVPLLTLTDVPRGVARGGLHAVDGNPIHVSPGVGVERGRAPQVRLFNRPAVGILTLADAPLSPAIEAGPRSGGQ